MGTDVAARLHEASIEKDVPVNVSQLHLSGNPADPKESEQANHQPNASRESADSWDFGHPIILTQDNCC